MKNGPELIGVSYVYAPDCKAERQIAILADGRGVLQVDGYSATAPWPTRAGVVRLLLEPGAAAPTRTVGRWPCAHRLGGAGVP